MFLGSSDPYLAGGEAGYDNLWRHAGRFPALESSQQRSLRLAHQHSCCRSSVVLRRMSSLEEQLSGHITTEGSGTERG